MIAAGCTPDMIQVGNEITNGMMWEVGRVNAAGSEGFDVLSRLLKSGVRACRELCPKARLIIHTERAGDWAVTKNFYEQMRRHQVDYDIIGLSYYPMWHDRLPVLHNTLDSLADLFPDKEVMIVETAAYYSHERDIWSKGPDQYAEFYPITTDGQLQFTKELMEELRKHKHVTGVFWWFPEENESGRQVTNYWLNRGLFDNHTGRAKPALYELKW
jgi:arabinogalactan endo-1,4-beta-galactosidase